MDMAMGEHGTDSTSSMPSSPSSPEPLTQNTIQPSSPDSNDLSVASIDTEHPGARSLCARCSKEPQLLDLLPDQQNVQYSPITEPLLSELDPALSAGPPRRIPVNKLERATASLGSEMLSDIICNAEGALSRLKDFFDPERGEFMSSRLILVEIALVQNRIR